MPTFIAYKDGKVVEKFTGAVPAKLEVSERDGSVGVHQADGLRP